MLNRESLQDCVTTSGAITENAYMEKKQEESICVSSLSLYEVFFPFLLI